MPTASVRSLELFIVSTSGIRNSFHAQMAWIIVTAADHGLNQRHHQRGKGAHEARAINAGGFI